MTPPYVGPSAGANEITIAAIPVIMPILSRGISVKIKWNIIGVANPVAIA